jgi:hypothetical protein
VRWLDVPAVADVTLAPPLLTTNDLAPIIAEAIDRWRAAGVPEEKLAFLSGWSFVVADLPGSQLGFTANGTIWLDRNAAGYGWFIDLTPADDQHTESDSRQGGSVGGRHARNGARSGVRTRRRSDGRVDLVGDAGHSCPGSAFADGLGSV